MCIHIRIRMIVMMSSTNVLAIINIYTNMYVSMITHISSISSNSSLMVISSMCVIIIIRISIIIIIIIIIISSNIDLSIMISSSSSSSSSIVMCVYNECDMTVCYSFTKLR